MLGALEERLVDRHFGFVLRLARLFLGYGRRVRNLGLMVAEMLQQIIEMGGEASFLHCTPVRHDDLRDFCDQRMNTLGGANLLRP